MKQLPNILTLANLFCGSVACILVIERYPIITTNIALFYLFCLSLIFDFLDGFAARAVKASSNMGKQLDSLADVVSFGLLPGLMMVQSFEGTISCNLFQNFPSQSSYSDLITFQPFEGTKSLSYFLNGNISYLVIPFCGLLITVFSAYRLAKFNLDKEQTYYFKGLPTPANAILIFSLYENSDLLFYIFDTSYYISLLVITALSCWLLVSNIPLFSLKIKNFSWKDNSLVFSFLLIAVILFLIFKMTAVPFIILTYILLSLIFKKIIIKKSNLD